MGRYVHGVALGTSADRDRVRHLEARLARASHALEKTTRLLEVERRRNETLRRGHALRLRDMDADERPPFWAAYTPDQMRHRPGNPHGEARLLGAAAEAARHRMTKETR